MYIRCADRYGNAIPFGTITVFKAGTSDPANLYDDAGSSTGSNISTADSIGNLSIRVEERVDAVLKDNKGNELYTFYGIADGNPAPPGILFNVQNQTAPTWAPSPNPNTWEDIVGSGSLTQGTPASQPTDDNGVTLNGFPVLEFSRSSNTRMITNQPPIVQPRSWWGFAVFRSISIPGNMILMGHRTASNNPLIQPGILGTGVPFCQVRGAVGGITTLAGGSYTNDTWSILGVAIGQTEQRLYLLDQIVDTKTTDFDNTQFIASTFAVGNRSDGPASTAYNGYLAQVITGGSPDEDTEIPDSVAQTYISYLRGLHGI